MKPLVLIVDEAPAVVAAARVALEAEGYVVEGAAKSADALRLARASRPAVILIDLSLGGIGAVALCEALANDAVLRTVPVILLVAAGDPLGNELRASVDALAMLEKPFHAGALLRVVRANLAEALARADQSDEQASLKDWAERIGQAAGPQREALLRECLSAFGSGPDVVLSGELASVPLAELLQMLALQNQTGLLRVETGSMSLELCFALGRIDFVLAHRAPGQLLLGRVLVAEGCLGLAELELFLRYRRHDRLVGQQLTALGYVTVEELRQALARQSSELIYELLRQRSGRFAFRRDAVVPGYASELRLGLSTDSLLMEGYRRVDELAVIEDSLGGRDSHWVSDLAAVAKFGHHNLTPHEQDVLGLCASAVALGHVIERSNLGTFDTMKALYRLSEARLVVRMRAAMTDHREASA